MRRGGHLRAYRGKGAEFNYRIIDYAILVSNLE